MQQQQQQHASRTGRPCTPWPQRQRLWRCRKRQCGRPGWLASPTRRDLPLRQNIRRQRRANSRQQLARRMAHIRWAQHRARRAAEAAERVQHLQAEGGAGEVWGMGCVEEVATGCEREPKRLSECSTCRRRAVRGRCGVQHLLAECGKVWGVGDEEE
eukprot:29782-Chlamydomonas_euryale.AAC.1